MSIVIFQCTRGALSPESELPSPWFQQSRIQVKNSILTTVFFVTPSRSHWQNYITIPIRPNFLTQIFTFYAHFLHSAVNALVFNTIYHSHPYYKSVTPMWFLLQSVTISVDMLKACSFLMDSCYLSAAINKRNCLNWKKHLRKALFHTVKRVLDHITYQQGIAKARFP